jgi:hypothetical protein
MHVAHLGLRYTSQNLAYPIQWISMSFSGLSSQSIFFFLDLIMTKHESVNIALSQYIAYVFLTGLERMPLPEQ